MYLFAFWLRLHAYGVLVVNPDGSITYGVWDYEKDDFDLDITGKAWNTIDERDRSQDDPHLWICQAGIVREDGSLEVIHDYDDGVTFRSLHEAVQWIAREIEDFGYPVIPHELR